MLHSWVGNIRWRRDRLPAPIFLGFPCVSAGKEFACNVGDLSSIPGSGRSLEKEMATHYSVSMGSQKSDKKACLPWTRYCSWGDKFWRRERGKQTNTSEPIVLSRMNKNKSSLGYIAVKPQKIQSKGNLEIQQRKWSLVKDQQLRWEQTY